MKPTITYVSLFSGIEAFSVAASRIRDVNWRPVFFSEIDPFASAASLPASVRRCRPSRRAGRKSRGKPTRRRIARECHMSGCLRNAA